MKNIFAFFVVSICFCSFVNAGVSSGTANPEVSDSSSTITVTLPDVPQGFNKSDLLAIFFSGSVNGFVESCKCKKAPYGGLMRAATYLKNEKKKYPEHLIIDAGDSFPSFGNGLLVTMVMNIFKYVGYDIAAVGEQEYSSNKFKNNYAKSKVPYLASNVKLIKDGREISMSAECLEFARCGKRVKVISVVDPSLFLYFPPEVQGCVAVEPPEKFLTHYTMENKDRYDLLILVSHCGLDMDKMLAKQFPEIGIIISGHANDFLPTPVKVGKTIIVNSGVNMQHMGKLFISFDKDNNAVIQNYNVKPLTNDIPEDPYIRRLYERYKEEMN